MSRRKCRTAVRPKPSVKSVQMTPGAGDLVLMGTDDPGSFLVLGGDWPEGAIEQLKTLSLIDQEMSRDIGQAVARATGVGNLGIQGLNSVLNAQGLVRLSPDTVRALETGSKALTQDGWNLGALAQNGQITQQVRWLPAGSPGAVAALAAIGPAAALMMVQWQLGEIAALAKKNTQLTEEVLELVRSADWASAQGGYDLVMEQLRIAQRTRSVTKLLWEHLQAQCVARDVKIHLALFRERVARHAEGLSRIKGAEDRRDWLLQHGVAVVRDCLALLMTERTHLVYHALWFAHLATHRDASEAERKQVDAIAKEAARFYQEAVAHSQTLLLALYSAFRLIEECPGALRLKIIGRQRTRDEVSKLASSLSAQIPVGGTPHGLALEPQLPDFPIMGVAEGYSGQVRGELAKRLRWIISPGESVQSAIVGFDRDTPWVGSTEYVIVFTTRRILVLNSASFKQAGLIDAEGPLSTTSCTLDTGMLMDDLGDKAHGGVDTLLDLLPVIQMPARIVRIISNRGYHGKLTLDLGDHRSCRVLYLVLDDQQREEVEQTLNRLARYPNGPKGNALVESDS